LLGLFPENDKSGITLENSQIRDLDPWIQFPTNQQNATRPNTLPPSLDQKRDFQSVHGKNSAIELDTLLDFLSPNFITPPTSPYSSPPETPSQSQSFSLSLSPTDALWSPSPPSSSPLSEYRNTMFSQLYNGDIEWDSLSPNCYIPQSKFSYKQTSSVDSKTPPSPHSPISHSPHSLSPHTALRSKRNISNTEQNQIHQEISSSVPHGNLYRFHHKSKGGGGRHRRRSTSRKDEDISRFGLDLKAVKDGRDGRTTLMIKNIPNKYNQEMLLETINKNYKGTFDFFYLPIDFKNKCNVGYAFINFIKPETVADFYEDFNQKKWEKFNSEKVRQITYARIQGKAAFIDHFRNSSLMYEDPACRPLIFYSNGPNIGTPEPFPPANLNPRSPQGNGHVDKE